MDEKKTKAVIYLKIVFLTMIYLGQRHPYMTVGLMVWCMGCIGIAISRSFSLGMMLIIGVVGIIVVIRWMFNTLEDFGSERKRCKGNCGKKKRLRNILSFWNKDCYRAAYCKR